MNRAQKVFLVFGLLAFLLVGFFYDTNLARLLIYWGMIVATTGVVVTICHDPDYGA